MSKDLTYGTFSKKIKKEGPERIYFFYGEEDFLLGQALEDLKRAFLGEDEEGETVVKYGEEMNDLSSFLNEAKTPSLLAPRRIMILKEADKIDKKKINWDEFERFCKDPASDVCSVFIIRDPDMRRKFPKMMKKVATVVKMKSPRNLDRWIDSRLKADGYKIDRRASEMLVELLGDNMLRLANELEKLKSACGEDKFITLEDTETTSRSKIHSIFEFADALALRDVEKAAGVLREMLEDGEEPVAITGTIRWKLSQLLEGCYMREKGKSDKSIIKQIGVPRYFKDKYFAQLEKFDSSSLEEILPRLREADRLLKSSSLDDRLILERFVFRVCEV